LREPQVLVAITADVVLLGHASRGTGRKMPKSIALSGIVID
jgi:hypothetical protein